MDIMEDIGVCLWHLSFSRIYGSADGVMLLAGDGSAEFVFVIS